MLHKILLTSLCLWVSNFVFSFPNPNVIIIPFKTVHNMVVFQATVGGQYGNYILDSGIADIVLNSNYFQEEMDFARNCDEFRSINAKDQPCRAGFVHFKWENISFIHYALVINLRVLERQKKLNILGLIGIGIFKDYEITIDYSREEIRLYPIDKKGNSLNAEPRPIPSETLAFKYAKHLPYILAQIDGVELKFGLDTGSETNVFSSKVLEKFRDEFEVLENKMLMGINGSIISVPCARVNNLQIGNRTVAVGITVFHTNPLNSLPLDGILGQEFFKQFQTAFNFKKKEIYLWDEDTVNQSPLAARKN